MSSPSAWLRCGAALAGLPAAMATSLLVGRLLQPWSVDRPIAPSDLLDWGWRWGLMLSTFLWGAACLGHRRPASPGRVLAGVGQAVGLLLGLTALGVLLALLALQLGWVGHGWMVPARRGLMLRMATETGLQQLGLPVAFSAAVLLWRSRRGSA